MIDQAKVTAQRLRGLTEDGWATTDEAADTIDALIAEVERLTKVEPLTNAGMIIEKLTNELNRKDAEIERLTKVDVEPVARAAGCTLCGYCAATGERIKGIQNLESLDD